MHGKGTFSVNSSKEIFTPIVLNPNESAASESPRKDTPSLVI